MDIENLNKEIRECNRCRLYGTRTNALCGEGDTKAKLMLVAQAPGETEDRDGNMFIGPSGKVLDKLLTEAGISRKEIYMTNLVKCMLPKNRKPKQGEIKTCSMYLDRELEMVNPEIIAPLGYYASKYIFEKYGVELPSKPEFREVYGRLLWSSDKKLLPLQHPAAVLHDPSIEEVLIRNYHKLKVVLKDCKWYPICPLKRYHEEGKLDRKWTELYCKGDWERCVRYHMEERGEPHPDWMLQDGSIDETLRDK